MAHVRLAAALLVPPPLSIEIDGIRRALGGDRARIAPHVTLVPPVDVPEAELGAALAVLRRGAASLSGPLELELGPAATFAPANRVLYLGVIGEDAELARLAALKEALTEMPLQRRERRGFVPHVTLTHRLIEGDDAHALALLGAYRVAVRFEHVVLLRHGSPDHSGRVWRPLADAALGPARVVGRGGVELEMVSSCLVDPEAAVLVEEACEAGGPGAPPGLGLDEDLDSQLVVTARRAAAVAGVAVARFEGTVARLVSLRVSLAERRQGIGRQLAAAITYDVGQAGAAALLWRSDPDDPLGALLASCGWAPATDWSGGEQLCRRLAGAPRPD